MLWKPCPIQGNRSRMHAGSYCTEVLIGVMADTKVPICEEIGINSTNKNSVPSSPLLLGKRAMSQV